MKKYIVIGIILVLAIGIFFFIKRQRIIKSDSPLKELTFSYNIGNSSESYKYYHLFKKENIWYVEFENSYYQDPKPPKYEVDDNFVKKIETILQKYEVYKWNGFDRVAKDILDGNGFQLSIHLEDDTYISAHGYHIWPNNYEEVRSSLTKTFESIDRNK